MPMSPRCAPPSSGPTAPAGSSPPIWRTSRTPGRSSRAGRRTAAWRSSAAAGRAPRTPDGRRSTSSSDSPPDGWLYDMNLVDLATGARHEPHGDRPRQLLQHGPLLLAGRSHEAGFPGLIDGNSHPFRMDRDGKNKRDLTKDSKEFAYGFSASKDGRRIAYHKSYQVYVADADGSNARKIDDRPSVQLRAPVVARRHAPALRRGRALQLPPVRGRRPTAPASASSPTGAATAA